MAVARIVYHAGKLMALGEHNEPFELDPPSLASSNATPISIPFVGLKSSRSFSPHDERMGRRQNPL